MATEKVITINNIKMEKGEELFKKATKELLKKKPNSKLAVSWMEKASTLGYPQSLYAIGTWYFHGKHYEKNIKKGIEFWRQAAKQNVPLALFDLAVSSERGVGLPKNEKKAFEYYLRAALFGNLESYIDVGRCYAHGIGVKRDRKIADIWLDKAEDLGLKW